MANEIIDFLVKAGHAAASADNTQPWRFCWNGEQLLLEYDVERAAQTTFPAAAPATCLAMGSVIENLDQARKVISGKIEVNIPERLNENAPCYCRTIIGEDARIAGQISELPLFKRHTNRLPYTNQPVPASILDKASTACEGPARTLLFADKEKIQVVGQLVRQASEVRFQTREVHEWLGRSLRFTSDQVKQGDGLDIATLALPPGGKLLMQYIIDWKRMARLNRIHAYKIMAMVDAKPVLKAPAVVAIISPHSFQGSVAAGQLMTRVWIELNAQDLAVQPYYVVGDQLERWRNEQVPKDLRPIVDKVVNTSRRLFQLADDETLHMLLRVGFTKHKPVRSRRLQLKDVFHDQTETD